jgi:sulfopyruvate decarboxylase TPP-binding subunit
MSAPASPNVDVMVSALVEAGVTHVLGIPDNWSGPLFDALAAAGRPRLIIVTREGEAFGMASGLWLGGASPLVIIQNTGLIEAGDALRGTAGRMGAPVPFVVTGRGYPKMERLGIDRSTPRSRELLVRADVDSVALLTEPTLDAWAVPWSACRSGDDVAGAVRRTVAAAQAQERPVALLLTSPLD